MRLYQFLLLSPIFSLIVLSSMKHAVPKNVGEYRYYDYCRFCFSKDIQIILDLGYMPLAGGFLKKISPEMLKNERYYPLQLLFCQKCYLVQTTAVISATILFTNYFYFSSKIKTLVDHFFQIIETIPRLLNKKDAFIVELGCNDGSFIYALLQKGYRTLGIDPAKNVVSPLIKKGMPIINTFFSEKVAHRIVNEYGQADAIYSFNTLAHIEDMHDIFSGIEVLLKPEGHLVFEAHYLGNLLKETQYDMIYHEHQYYYSLLAIQSFLTQHDMHVFDVELVPIHAGSIRFSVQKTEGKRKITSAVHDLVQKEKKLGLHKIQTYQNFAKQIKKTKKDLMHTIAIVKSKKKTIIGYGASGRGTILMNYCGLDSSLIDYVVDDAPARQHVFIPGVHVKTYASIKIKSNKIPDYILLFAWSFYKEIAQKQQDYLKKGGKFILPLPKVKIIGK